MAKKIKSPYKALRKYRYRENYCTTLHKVFDYATTTYGKKVAFQFVDGGQQYTYADFRTKTERLSQRMSRFGIKQAATKTTISGNANDENNYEAQPVQPKKEQVKTGKKFTLDVAPYSMVMLEYAL